MMATTGGIGFESGWGNSGGWRRYWALPEKPASPKSKTPPSWPTSQYPPPSGVGVIDTIGSLRAELPVRSPELCVAVVENPSVGSDESIAVAVGGGVDGHDGPVEMKVACRPEEGAPETEHAAVTRRLPSNPPTGPISGDTDDRLVQVLATHRTVELRIAEAEHPAIAGDFPVALPIRRGEAYDGLVEGPSRPLNRSKLGVTEGENSTIAGDFPVPALRGLAFATPPTIGFCSGNLQGVARRRTPAPPKVMTPPAASTMA